MSLEIKKSKDRVCIPAFVDYVRSLLCCVPGCGKPASPSHMKSRKFADGSDALVINACVENGHHVSSTKTSREILILAGINIEELHVKLWNGFLREQGIIRYVKTQEEFESVCETFGLREKAPTRRKNR